MDKIAITAQKLREVALKAGLLPEQGEKWKTIAKKLVKVTSKKFPSPKSKEQLMDEVLPDRKYFKKLKVLDGIVSAKYPAREYSGFISKETGFPTIKTLGSRGNTYTIYYADRDKILFHKHPFSTSYPSKPDIEHASWMLKYLKEEHLKGNQLPNKIEQAVYNGDSAVSGITRYSTRYTPKNKEVKTVIDYAYRAHPENYNLRGLMKVKQDEEYALRDTILRDRPPLMKSELHHIRSPEGPRTLLARLRTPKELREYQDRHSFYIRGSRKERIKATSDFERARQKKINSLLSKKKSIRS